jgi:hypothetical protein
MSAAELLADLRRQGCILTVLPEGKVSVRPAERLTDTLREALRCYKTEVLAALAQQPERPHPYLTPQGDLIVPCDCDVRYRWWAGGQSVAATLAELNAPPEVWPRHTEVP